jgi:hypothetical protein
MSNEGSLFVVVIAPIEGVEERNSTGLTVSLGGDTPVPIGHLTNNFITSNCATFSEKPKVFIFIDPGVATNSMDRGVLVSTLKNQNKLLLHKKVRYGKNLSILPCRKADKKPFFYKTCLPGFQIKLHSSSKLSDMKHIIIC